MKGFTLETPMNIQIEKYKLSLSFGFNLILILLVIIFLNPLLNSGDDAFILYSFSGGFNIPPTELVDYSWGWHFLLGLLVKKLFILIPNVNWYSILLLSFHWVASSIILHFFLSSFRFMNALFYFAIFFLIFETTLILSLNFSSTSIILAIAANVILLEKFNNKEFKKIDLITPLILILLAGLLRFHTWIFVEIILGLFVFFISRKKVGFYLIYKVGILILLFTFFTAHQYYYKSEIRGWEEKEKLSQALYSYYNAPKKSKQFNKLFKDSIEFEFFYNNFSYDTQILSNTRLKEISTGLQRVRNLSNPEDKSTLNWVFINGRLYFLTLFLPLLFLIVEKKWYLIKRILPFLFFSLILYGYLFFFRKVTESIFMGFLITNWFVYFIFLAHIKIKISRLSQLIFIPLILFCFVWGIARIYKINLKNIEKYNEWICYYNDLKRNSSFIHVAVNSEIPIDYFSVLDSPAKFPIHNFISVSQFTIKLFEEKKKHLGLKNITEDLINRPDVVLTGPEISSLKSYYLKKHDREVDIVYNFADYNCAKIYQVVKK